MENTHAKIAGMDRDTLTLFVEVASHLSFAAVATQRGVNASSVSRSISQLEAALDLRLFHRSTRRMTLTEGGATFLRHATLILDQMEAAIDAARGATSLPNGTLRLTASVAFGQKMILPLMPDFQALYPDITVDLQLTDANLDLVAEGMDLAIRLGTHMQGDLVQTKLLDTQYVLCASPAYLERSSQIACPSDLSSHPCLTLSLDGFRGSWKFVSGSGPVSVPVRSCLTTSAPLALRTAALLGMGPGVFAEWLVRADIAAGRLVTLLPAFSIQVAPVQTAAWLIYPNRSYLPRKTRVMIDYLKTHYA